jgi:hypothetical protein
MGLTMKKMPPKLWGFVLSTVFALAAVWPAPGHAVDLIIVEQTMLRFVCMFDADCSKSVTPAGISAMPTDQRGSDPRLVSFSFEAKAGSPAAGTTFYVYRVDLTRADSTGECLAGLVINFGPPAIMPFATAHAAHVFVVTAGGPGTVAIKSAEQDREFIQFNFDGPLCGGQSSLLFGLPSNNPPGSSNAMLFGYGTPPVTQALAHTPRY